MATEPIRILVEHPAGVVRLDLIEELEAAGFTVDACPGPGGARCPLTTGGGCDAAERADVIVNALGTDRLDVYLAQRTLLGDTPICLDVDERRLGSLGAVLADVRPAGPVPMGTALVARIQEALGAR